MLAFVGEPRRKKGKRMPSARTQKTDLSASSFDRADPQFFNVFDLPWASYGEHEVVRGLEARLVTRDASTGAATYFVRVPAGWRRAVSAADYSLECFLLEGDLAVGER